MFQLDFTDRRPIYEQIKEKIEELIIKGALKENEKIPSVRELALKLAINPNTIQKAYRELENDGFIYSVKAKGSFVAPKSAAAKKSDNDELLEEFKTLTSRLKFVGTEFDILNSILKEEYERKD